MLWLSGISGKRKVRRKEWIYKQGHHCNTKKCEPRWVDNSKEQKPLPPPAPARETYKWAWQGQRCQHSVDRHISTKGTKLGRWDMELTTIHRWRQNIKHKSNGEGHNSLWALKWPWEDTTGQTCSRTVGKLGAAPRIHHPLNLAGKKGLPWWRPTTAL